MKRIVVVGGGIAGLATAYRLGQRAREGGAELLVLEEGDRVGGNIRTERADGFTVEWGPNGYLDNVAATRELVREVGLEEELQPADERAAKRFLYRDGRLHALPLSPLAFFASPVLSPGGRFRILGEPFARPKPAGVDETVAAFATRRIGAEAARVLVDAMVSGVYAGNVDRLSLQSAFPRMAQMEAEHGSLVRAMIAIGRARRRARREGKSVAGGGPAGPAGRLTSFRGGLDTLPRRLESLLESSVQQNVRVEAVERDHGSWIVRTASDGDIRADAVLLAVPGAKAQRFLSGELEPLGRELGEIPTAPLAVVALAYEAGAIGGEPDGFGFLVPRLQGPRILGCLWDSSIFPGRAASGSVLLRAMIGGAHDPGAVDLSDGELLAIVRRDLATTMRLHADPARTWIFRHRLGIAQYDVGHQARLDRIHDQLARLPGLWVAGSSYYGVAMNSCIENATRQAESIWSYLREREPFGQPETVPPTGISPSRPGWTPPS